MSYLISMNKKCHIYVAYSVLKTPNYYQVNKGGEIMKMYYFAHIEWMAYEDGGRRTIPPKGTRYCPLIRLDNGVKQSEWSIDFICPDLNDTVIKFCFICDDAPCSLLKIDKEYNLYEGLRAVAKIKIWDVEQ